MMTGRCELHFGGSLYQSKARSQRIQSLKISQGRSHDKRSTFRLKGAAACLSLLLLGINDVSDESAGALVDP